MKAKDALELGLPALIATDTVYGLSCRIDAIAAKEHIFELKKRPKTAALPVFITQEMFEQFAKQPSFLARELAQMFWPGALTLVVPASDFAIAKGFAAPDQSIALRCPDASNALAYIRESAMALYCTSANIHGQPPATKRSLIPAHLRQLPGFDELPKSCGALASTIVDCTASLPRVLREGVIGSSVIMSFVV